MVEAQEQWRWSSYGGMMGAAPVPSWEAQD
jgi:hypothetical protein